MKASQRGFTLVEMIVAVALFAVVMLISVGALLALVGANRKAEALQSVMNNLNVSLDDMVRSIRMGSDFRCGGQTSGTTFDYPDCSTGSDALFITPFGKDPANRSDDWGYIFDSTGAYCGKGRICKVIGNGTPIAITSPNISIDSMTFYVVGTTRGDTTQPKVVISIKGTADGDQIKTVTNFTIQATAVQRLLDL